MKKSKPHKLNKRKGLLFKIIKATISGFYGRVKYVGEENIPQEPCIFIGNHAQMHGPIVAELRSPFRRYTWCIGNMLHLREFPKYAFQDFWGYKPKWTHWFYKMLACIIAPLGTYIFRNADVIGVYKDMRGRSTFRNSIRVLNENYNLIIFPECHTEFNEIVNEFQDKFVDLARMYFKETGKELMFVPMYIAPSLRTIVYGKPIKFNSQKSITEQRKEICDYLKIEVTNLAKTLPAHTVIPYANIPKNQYPKSK